MKKILLFLLLSIVGYGQTTTGQEQEFDYGIKNNSTQTVTNPNTLVTQGADGTYGKASVNNIPISIPVQDSLNKKLNLPTGFLQGLQLSINVDPTKYNIAAGYYVVTDFTNLAQPVVKIITYAGATGLSPTYLATANSTYVALDINGTVVSSASPFTDAQRRTLAIVGNVVHSNNTTINVTNEIKAPIVAIGNQVHDFMKAVGFLNENGNIYSANGANLMLNKSSGDIFGMGINSANYLNPHKLTIPTQTALTFAYRFQNGTQLADTQNINPNIYDVGGVSTAVPVGSRWTVQRINLFQSGLARIQPGQTVYTSFNDAVIGLPTQAFVTEQNIADNAVFRCYLIVQQGTTNLSSAVAGGTAQFVPVDKFGNVIGNGSVALTYNNIIAALGYTPENVANKQNSLAVDGTGVKYATVDAVNAALPKNYAIIVYVNSINPNTATIFDIVNPPITNNNALKNDVNNLYIGTDTSTWVYDSVFGYVTKTMPSISNFFLSGTSTDAGSDKLQAIKRNGTVESAGFIKSGGLVSQFLKANGTTDGTPYALQDGTILYHLVKWFEPSSTVSSSGTTVTSMGAQFSSAMVGAKLIINGEQRIITTYTSTTVVIINSAYSVNYSGVIAGSWGIYNKAIEVLTDGTVRQYNPTGGGNIVFGTVSYGAFVDFSVFSNIKFTNNSVQLGSSTPILMSSTTSSSGTKDIGLRRNAAGILEAYNGVTADGTLTNRRDLLTRNLFSSKVFANTTTDNGIDVGQFNGTISASPATTSNQLVVKSQLDLKADLVSPTFTGTPTSPTATVGTNTTQIATTAFVQASTASVASAVYGSDVSLSSGQSPYTLQLSDANARLTTNGTFNQNYSIVIPTNAAVPFQIGTKIRINCSANQPGFVTLSGSGVVFEGLNLSTPTIRHRSSFIITKIAIDTWYIDELSLWATDTSGNIVQNTDKGVSGSFIGSFIGSLNSSKFPSYTVATLPMSSPLAVIGNMAYVTDALSPTYMTTVVGGGAVVTPVFYNGVNWVAH